MNRSANLDSRDKASLSLNLGCFASAIAGGFGLHFLLPTWTGVMFIYWAALVLIVTPQVAIWSESRRVKMAAWSGFVGGICLLGIFFSILIPFWK